MAGLLMWLLGWRALEAWTALDMRRWEWAAPLSVAVAVLTAFGEALYYDLLTPAPFLRVLDANLSLDLDMLRPSWWVLAITLGVSVIAAARQTTAKAAKKRASAAARP